MDYLYQKFKNIYLANFSALLELLLLNEFPTIKEAASLKST